MINILLITNKGDITTDFIVQRLHERKTSFYRLNTDEISKTIEISFDIVNGSYFIKDKLLNTQIDLTKFSAVYFRRPELPIPTQSLDSIEVEFIQSEITGVLEGMYRILQCAYWISNVFSIRNAENKIYQLMMAKDLGFRIPQSLISNSFENANKFFVDQRNCIIKPIRVGRLGDEKIIFTNRLESFPEDTDEIESCPQFFQEEIKKRGDVRVTVVGKKVFSALIHSQENPDTITDWRKGQMELNHSEHQLPIELEKLCIALVSQLELGFGAIDLILDEEGNYFFLEINPNGQWAWIESQLGFDISGEIVNLLINESTL
jgi:glutathione synthase/RimK-type ligase-like ATP-grasp enzyme